MKNRKCYGMADVMTTYIQYIKFEGVNVLGGITLTGLSVNFPEITNPSLTSFPFSYLEEKCG